MSRGGVGAHGEAGEALSLTISQCRNQGVGASLIATTVISARQKSVSIGVGCGRKKKLERAQGYTLSRAGEQFVSLGVENAGT